MRAKYGSSLIPNDSVFFVDGGGSGFFFFLSH